jgi:uncharacterized membrane protein
MSDATKQYSHHISVPSDQGTRVDKSISIHKPVEEVYSFWSKLENLPRFMRHLESVKVRDDLHSHWVARTVGEKTLAWDAEIIDRRENQMISWRSTPGSEVEHAGSVWFKPVSAGSGTEIRVELKYLPPAGKGGVLFAKIFGRDAGAEIEEDLYRLKALLETGQLPPEPRVRQWQRQALEKTRNVAGSADLYVHENPWPVIGSVAALFFVLGLLVGLSRD